MAKIIVRQRKELFFDYIKVTIDKSLFFLERNTEIEIDLPEGEHSILIESYLCKTRLPFKVVDQDNLTLIIERTRYKCYITALCILLLFLIMSFFINIQPQWLTSAVLLLYFSFPILDMIIYRKKYFRVRFITTKNNVTE